MTGLLSALPAEYHCSGNGSWVNEVLGAELPKCVPGNQAPAWAAPWPQGRGVDVPLRAARPSGARAVPGEAEVAGQGHGDASATASELSGLATQNGKAGPESRE